MFHTDRDLRKVRALCVIALATRTVFAVFVVPRNETTHSPAFELSCPFKSGFARLADCKFSRNEMKPSPGPAGPGGLRGPT